MRTQLLDRKEISHEAASWQDRKRAKRHAVRVLSSLAQMQTNRTLHEHIKWASTMR